MPYKRKPAKLDVNAIRAEAYQAHFAYRQFARNHARQREIAGLVSKLPRPTLTLYGFESIDGNRLGLCDYQGTAAFYDLADHLGGMDVGNLLWWYWSDEGWAAFEELWKNLPESIHIPLCMNGKDFLIHTQVEQVPEMWRA